MVITYVIDKDLVMKRIKLFSTLLLTLFLSSEGFSQSFEFTGGSFSHDGSRVGSNSRTDDSGRTVTTNVGCKVNDYIKLDYLKSLFTTDPNNFKVSIDKNQSQLKIHMPGYITNCMKLEFKVEYHEDNNVTVKAYNSNYTSSGELEKDQAFQKYVQCLKDEGVIEKVGDTNHYRFNRSGDNIKKMQPGYRTIPLQRGDLNPRKDVKAYFLSPPTPETGNLGMAHPVNNAPSYEEGCYWVEHMNEKKQSIAYLSPDSRAERTVQNCLTSYENIINALRSLDRNVLGNYDELRGILEKALVETLDEKAESIYKKMEKLKGKVSFSDGEPDVDSDEAADILEDYADEMRNLNREVIEPYLKRIDELMTELDSANDEARESKIREQIRKLKAKIKKYSDKPKSLGYNDMMKIARHYGHTSDARVIEGFRLKSLVYGNLGKKITHPTKRKKIKVNFNNADDIVKDAVTHFDEKIADVWETEADVRSGDASAVRSAQNRHTALTRSRDQRFKSSMEKIQSDYKSCVGWFHTQYKIQKCQQKAQMSQKRAMAQRAYYNKQIGQASTQYNHYMGIYQTYQRSLASTDGTSTFDDPFGIYSDPFGSVGGMDPMSYYNMGVNNNFGGGAGFNPFGNAGMGMGMGNGMGMMPGSGYQMMPF